jgi:hypothetical protein
MLPAVRVIQQAVPAAALVRFGMVWSVVRWQLVAQAAKDGHTAVGMVLLAQLADLAGQGIELLLLADDDLVQVVDQVLGETGLDLEIGQALVEGGVRGLLRMFHGAIGRQIHRATSGAIQLSAGAVEDPGMLPPLIPRRRWCALALALLAATARAAAPIPADAPRLVLADHGAQILDPYTGLAWSRCVEGMRWNGRTCTGRPVRVSHAQALALAAARKGVDGFAWRLPRVTELERLVHRFGPPPGLDPVLFPAAPAENHWATTASIELHLTPVDTRPDEDQGPLAFLHGWAVNPATGEARGDVLKRSELPVRLVWALRN